LIAFFSSPGENTHAKSCVFAEADFIAIKQHHSDAYRLIGASRELPQTDGTIAWVIDELNAETTATFENYAYNLSTSLPRTPAARTSPRRQREGSRS
jgi:hypothetical protein